MKCQNAGQPDVSQGADYRADASARARVASVTAMEGAMEPGKDDRIPRVAWLAAIDVDPAMAATCFRRAVGGRRCVPEALYVLHPVGAERSAGRLVEEARRVLAQVAGQARAETLEVSLLRYDSDDLEGLGEKLVVAADLEVREGLPVALDLSSCRSPKVASMACIIGVVYPGLLFSVYCVEGVAGAGGKAETELTDLMRQVVDYRSVEEAEREDAWFEDFPW